MKSLSALSLIAALLTSATARADEPSSVYLEGATGPGYLVATHDSVYTFAASFKGNYNFDVCQKAASKAAIATQNPAKYLRMNEANDIGLQHNQTYLVVGVLNATANNWGFVCINVGASGQTTTWIDESGNTDTSTGWVQRNHTYNGYQFNLKFADMDNGHVQYSVISFN